jgi:Aluminium activated malate transporter
MPFVRGFTHLLWSFSKVVIQACLISSHFRPFPGFSQGNVRNFRKVLRSCLLRSSFEQFAKATTRALQSIGVSLLVLELQKKAIRGDLPGRPPLAHFCVSPSTSLLSYEPNRSERMATANNGIQEGSPLLVGIPAKYLDEESGLSVGSESSISSGYSHTFSESSSGDVNKYMIPIHDLVEEEEGPKKHQSLWSRIDKGALQFALRMAVLLSISALFVLIRTDNWFVCWFPALDAASVIEKIVQRLIGTFVGAVLGLSCGFISIYFFKSRTYQSIFLEVCMFVIVFGIIFGAGQAKVGSTKVIRKFAYATILCVLTFCICMLPFAGKEDPKWHRGVWRIINVIVGCFLGALGSIVVCPKSTTEVLHDKAARQVKMAGDAAEAVLHTASDFFAGRIAVNRLADDLLETPLESAIEWKFLRSNSLESNSSEESIARADIALKKYEEAIADWRLSKMLFPLANYDPFHLTNKNPESEAQQTEIARTLARALRIQTTIVVMDGMVRNDAEYDFLPSHLSMFAQAGSLIKVMLTIPLHHERSDKAARRLFDCLEETRSQIRTMSRAVSTFEDKLEKTRDKGINEFRQLLLESNPDLFLSERTMGDEAGRGIPKDVTGCHDNTLFFLQLVEHLILRSLRLYQAWKHVKPNK